MKKVLYVNGCSHSCGSEISYPNSHRTPEDLKNSWAGQLSDRFNLVHYNDATGGQDNFSILSNTIHSILNLLDQYKSDEIFVIIGWSGFDRENFIYNDVRYKFLSNPDPCFKEWPNIVQQIYRNYILGTDLNNNSAQNKFSLMYISLINFLKIYNIEYYFFNALHEVQYPIKNLLHETSNELPTVKIFDQIQRDPNYLEPFNNRLTYYTYMTERYDGQIDGRRHHFLAEAQTEWANILAAKIENKI